MASVAPVSKVVGPTPSNKGKASVLDKFPLPDAFHAIKAEVAPITSRTIAIPLSIVLPHDGGCFCSAVVVLLFASKLPDDECRAV